MKKFAELIKKADYLGEPPGWSIAGKSSFETIPGALLSLIYFGLLFWGTLTFFLEYIDTTSPSIIQTNLELSSFPKIDLLSNKLAPAIILFGNRVKPVAIEDFPRYFTIKAYHYEISAGEPSKEIDLSVKQAEVPVVPCNQLSAAVDSEVYSSWKSDQVADQLRVNSGFCLDAQRDSFYIHGKTTEKSFAFVGVYIMPCSLQANCATEEELSDINVNFVLPKFSLNFSDYNSPTQLLPVLDKWYPVHPVINQQHMINIKQNRIIDSAGYLKPSKITREFADVNTIRGMVGNRNSKNIICSAQQILDFACNSYMSFEFFSSGTDITIERKYVGLLDFLSSIGGLKEVLVVAATIMYGWYHSRASRSYLVEEIFKLKEDQHERAALTKETQLKKSVKVLFNTAEDLIEQSLDIVTVIRELNRVKLIVELLFNCSSSEQNRRLLLQTHLAITPTAGSSVLRMQRIR